MGYKPRNKKFIRHYPRHINRDRAGIISYLEACKSQAFDENCPEKALWLEVIASVIRDIVAPPNFGRTVRVNAEQAAAWLCNKKFALDREIVFSLAGLEPGIAATFAKKLGLALRRKTC